MVLLQNPKSLCYDSTIGTSISFTLHLSTHGYLGHCGSICDASLQTLELIASNPGLTAMPLPVVGSTQTWQPCTSLGRWWCFLWNPERPTRPCAFLTVVLDTALCLSLQRGYLPAYDPQMWQHIPAMWIHKSSCPLEHMYLSKASSKRHQPRFIHSVQSAQCS